MKAVSRPRSPLRRSSVAVALLVAVAATGGALPMAPPSPVAAVPCDPTRDPDCDPGGGIEMGTVSVTLTGAGSTHGTVTSDPAGISCGTTCEAEYPVGATVTLTATADAGWSHTGWSGCDSVSGATCDVSVTEAGVDVSASFADLTSPTGSFLRPVHNGSYRGVVRFEATASDAGSGVNRVEFLVGSSIVASDQLSPYVAFWDSQTSATYRDGTFTVTARIVDNAGRPVSFSRTVTIDNTGPAGAITSPGPDTVVAAPIPVRADATDGGTGMSSVSFGVTRVGGDPWSTTFATDTSGPWEATFDPGVVPADGAYDLRAVMTDRVGNQSWSAAVRVIVDRVAPTASTNAQSRYKTSRSFPVSWSGSDGGSGVASYDVRYRRAAFNEGTFGAWTTWLSAVRDTSATFTGAPGDAYCFSSRSRDRGGLVSEWSPAECTSVALDDRSMKPAPSGAWKRNASPDARYFDATFSRSSRAGAKLTRKGIQATQVAIVVTRCRSCGKVAILWNGSKVRTVKLANPTMRRKQVIEVVTFGSMQFGTLTLKQVSGGKRVEVDGVLFAKDQ